MENYPDKKHRIIKRKTKKIYREKSAHGAEEKFVRPDESVIEKFKFG